VIHEFEVPQLGTLRSSTPVLSDTPQAAERRGGGRPARGRLVALARREFATGSNLMCQFEVYGAKVDDKTGMPRVLQGYVVRAATAAC
jgi:hypothetical protein